jgi:sugar lactone lactonase YvrE
MCADNQGGLWVAFWGSSEVRRLDENFKVSEVISVPAMFASSCAFIGPDLDILMITTAQSSGRAGDPFDDGVDAGKTFICKPGATGRATASFAI